MKIIITAKTGKGEKSTELETDETVDEVVKIANSLRGKLKWVGHRCYPDGTSLIIERK